MAELNISLILYFKSHKFPFIPHPSPEAYSVELSLEGCKWASCKAHFEGKNSDLTRAQSSKYNNSCRTQNCSLAYHALRLINVLHCRTHYFSLSFIFIKWQISTSLSDKVSCCRSQKFFIIPQAHFVVLHVKINYLSQSKISQSNHPFRCKSHSFPSKSNNIHWAQLIIYLS